MTQIAVWCSFLYSGTKMYSEEINHGPNHKDVTLTFAQNSNKTLRKVTSEFAANSLYGKLAMS